MNKIKLATIGSVLSVCLASSASAVIIGTSGFLVNTDVDDFYFSVTTAGLVTINVTETVDDGSDFDSEINLFSVDGTLGLEDFIANDDDGGGGPSGLESLLVTNLAVGNYLLRIGTHSFGQPDGSDPVILGAINTDGHHTGTDYTLTIDGDVATSGSSSSVPDGGSTASLMGLAIFGLAALRRKLA